MDTTAHAVVGAGVFATYAASGSSLGTGVAIASFTAAVLGAEAPDIDIVYQLFRGPVAYLYQHRQISHSLPMWFVYSFVIAGIVDLFASGHFWLYFWLSLAGVLTHVGTDMLTTYGTRAFWPFTNRRWHADCLFVVEPIYIILFVIGLVLVQLGSAFVPTVIFLDLVAIIYTLWRIVLRLWLGRILTTALAPEEREIWRVIPTIFPVPHGYKYVVKNGLDYRLGSFTWTGTPVEEARITSQSNPAVTFALKHSRVGRAMAWFSPTLIADTRQDGAWTVVRLADASVRYGDSLCFSGVIDLAKTKHDDFTVIHEGLRAQDLHTQKLWHDSFRAVGERIRLYIPIPRGYRSKSRD
ncbi:metal-dependent hydrolase [Alicyclobacillus dauci]|uniref:Metal-dependent hydrolase n=1 Tax=Alicyclobacillus dauci TaxID=1475485 RepID=A0ABY6Z539_9BACL|nr:metal-dependent hydrolase [Alicyclobacillus dauci]WAH37869.1 metal-dependent hydrolase [Alicyclobacillus dauci]